MSAFIDFFRRLFGLSPLALDEVQETPTTKTIKSIPKTSNPKADTQPELGDGLSARERAELIEKERKAKRLEKREARRKRKEERALRVSSRRSKKAKAEPSKDHSDENAIEEHAEGRGIWR